uniref:Uncharacterized protein n=1 Tax=Naja naja TaxID=35670 RepID=A0A8C6VQF2_NAJNA
MGHNEELPKISEEIKLMLEEKITMMELIEALNRQKNEKVPGPNGLPAELYKMLEVLNEVLIKAKVPNSWMEAYITLIPKEDSDFQWIKKPYRPISLLNADYKIFASIMGERLQRFLNHFTNVD